MKWKHANIYYMYNVKGIQILMTNLIWETLLTVAAWPWKILFLSVKESALLIDGQSSFGSLFMAFLSLFPPLLHFKSLTAHRIKNQTVVSFIFKISK